MNVGLRIVLWDDFKNGKDLLFAVTTDQWFHNRASGFGKTAAYLLAERVIEQSQNHAAIFLAANHNPIRAEEIDHPFGFLRRMRLAVFLKLPEYLFFISTGVA